MARIFQTMADSDDKWQVGKINNEQKAVFNAWLDSYAEAVANLSIVSSDSAAIMAAFLIELPTEDYPEAAGVAESAQAAIDGARAALDPFGSRPEIGFELFGFSHKRRVSKRVEARQ